MRVFKLAAGLAVGYVLGSRAGREKYDQIVAVARKAQGHPAVQETQEKAQALLDTGATTPSATEEPVPSYPETTSTPVPRPPRRQGRKSTPSTTASSTTAPSTISPSTKLDPLP